MSITPVTPGPIPSSGDPLAYSALTTPAVNPTTYSDSIASGAAINIVDFSSKMLSTKNEANDIAWEIQQANANSRQKMYYASIQNSLDLLQLYQLYLAVAITYANAYQVNKPAVNALTPSLVAYNSNVPSDINAVNTINAAINDFNAGNITQAQLQTAINTYNSYAASHNTQATATNNAINTFNNSANSTNASIDDANQELINAGLPPLATQDVYTDSATAMPILGSAPASPPFGNVTYTPAPLSLVANTMDPKGDEDAAAVASAFMETYFDLAAGQFAITAETLQAQSSFNTFVQFNLQAKLPFVPDSFYTQAPRLGGTSSGSGAGAGVSLGSIIASLSNPLMEGIIAQSIFTTNTNLNSKPDSPNAVDQLQYLGLSLLTQIGLQAGSSSVRLLEGRLPFIDLRSSPVAVALGLTLASEASQLVSSGAIAAAVKEIVAKSFTGSPEDLDKLASQLTDGLELFILQTALFQAGQGVGSPQLFGQVLSTTTNAQANGLVKAQTSQADILSDNTLKENLIRDIANRANINADIIRKSINAAAAARSNEFDPQAFITSLEQQGIQSEEAITAESIAQSSLKSEIIGRGVLQNRVTNEQINGTVLDNQLVKEIVTAQPDITNRQLRDQLADRFVANGATQTQALDTATTVVVGTPVTAPVSNEALSANLQTQASTQFSGPGVNAADTATFASNFVSVVLGPNVPGSQTSLRDLIDERLSRLTSEQNANFSAAVQANFDSFKADNYDVATFADRLRDPANTFLLCAQTGIMYAHPQPSNYLKSVDIAG